VASGTPSRTDRPRRPLPLRWRLVLLVGIATVLLSVTAVISSYLVVRSSLHADLRANLREDALRVAALYGSGEPGSAGDGLSGPTGGVTVLLFDLTGRFLVSSSETGAAWGRLIPPAAVRAAAAGVSDWQHSGDGTELLAALAPFEFGVAGVISDTSFIQAALARIARVLALVGTGLVLAGAVIAWLVAGRVMQPIRNLARQAARLGPDNLRPIAHSGSDDELGLLGSVLNLLIERLREALETQRQFLVETSHELRTPLTSLQGFLERARRRAGPETDRELGAALRISRNMGRLVEDLLQLSRGENVREPDLHLVDPQADLLEPVAAEFPGVTVRDGPPLLLVGDPGRLLQLVRNLTANAVRAAGAERVELQLSADADAVRLTVRDYGTGIPPEERERIFEKFFRGTGGGAGLGLAIARQITEQHGGRIGVQSRPGLTEFTVELPRPDTDEDGTFH